jgi:GT2 family glycosyltransferase
VIVSFNTREVLKKCLSALLDEAADFNLEIFVVDNASQDGSAEMVSRDFPQVRMLSARRNLGFAAANNLAFGAATGDYVILLNSDAFLCPGSLASAVAHMESEPNTALGGGRLIGADGSWQPSARQFPGLVNDFLALSGLAHRFRESRFCGRADRTWADPMTDAAVDWVPGAFTIIRSEVLEKLGGFDESFFLYYEEVDLCRRIKACGYQVRYWADVVVVHLGGESSKSMESAVRSKIGAQLTLWRLRSAYLYYRKHHGYRAWGAMAMEYLWHAVRFVRNAIAPARREKAKESRAMLELVRQAWRETRAGTHSPAKPW